jgi:hypothetical protein
MHRPLTQKWQFNGERDLGYTFAVAEWNVFGNQEKKAVEGGPAVRQRRPSEEPMTADFFFAIKDLRTFAASARKFTL